ncbi:MAG: DUF2075 domain-containing protein [Acholeplasmataceae bacterium]|jgi:hypothetical protein|nr:DUF2075 domain-containing protein [Acholeplasmataceae bacterium]
MIAYKETLRNFYSHIEQNVIAEKVMEKLGRVGESEQRAFRNSLPAIANSLRNANLPDEVQVGIEYKIPLTSKRVDFIIAGSDEDGKDHIIVVELKQWDKVKHTDMSDIVLVGSEEHVHPSWQAYTYASTIENFNDYVQKERVEIKACAFLHNYKTLYKKELFNPIYKEGLDKAQPFISSDYIKLADFVKKHVKHASKRDLIFEIENGKIKPSKMLIDSLARMLNGNKEYELIAEQRIVFSNLYKAVKNNQNKNNKQVFIVRGGAGTGKSLIAIQLLGELYKNKGYKTFYVAKSSYVKENYFAKLTKDVPNYKFLKTLFKGSGEFIGSIKNEFDVLIVDEAHRLTEKTKRSWLFLGENQIREIIHASKTSIFFIDETQNIDIKDFGTVDNIIRFAKLENAEVHCEDKFILKSQFRCNGSDEYIAWLDSVLYNKEFKSSFTNVDYDIKIFDDLNELHRVIKQKNYESNLPSRLLSGDVFDWVSKDDKNAIDINIGNFRKQWNKTKAFASDPKSIEEVGCIHTSQGMEFEYTGLIVANDLFYENGEIKTDYTKHPAKATEFKRAYKQKIIEEDIDIIDKIIRNTYKVLFTRGQKGTYLYFMDENLKKYFKEKIDILLTKY